MTVTEPYPPRMVALITAFLSAGIAVSSNAQEYSPVVNDRVEGGVIVEPAVPVNDDAERTGGLEIAAVISAAYDSNIFLSKDDPQSDTIYRISPDITYTHGDAKEGEGGFIQFAYRPTAVIYSKADSENRTDHQLAIQAGWRGKVSGITYTGGLQQLGDATADTGRQTDRLVYKNELRGAWMPREKVTLELAVGNGETDYNDPTLFDSRKVYGELAARYAYSPKTEVGIAYQVGTYAVDGASKQDTQQLTAQIAWQPREKIRINLEAGAEHRETENTTNVNPVLEGKIAWTPSQGTELYVTAFQREEASAFYSGQNYNVKGAAAGISQRLGDKWTARLEGGRETSSYSLVAGSGISGRKDKMWFIRPALEYRVNDRFNISLFYRVSDNSSSSSDFGYDEKTGGIEMNYKF